MTQETYHLSELNFFYPSTQFFSDFEGFCQQGDLIAIKKLELINKESLFLKGLFLCIHHHQLELFHYFTQHPFYQTYLLRHFSRLHHHLLEKKMFDFIYQLKNIKKNSLRTEFLGPSVEIAMNNIFCFYHSQLAANHLEAHFTRIRTQISELWQLNPPCYQQQSLPLAFDGYQTFQSSLNPSQLHHVNNIYLNHPLHICWRLFSPNEAWPEREKLQNQKDILKLRAWSVVLFWLAANDTLNLSPKVHLNFRLDYFFRRLSQFSDHLENLDNYLLHSVIAHPLCQGLDSDHLYLEFLGFFQNLDSRPSDFKLFDRHMQEKWHNQWSENMEIQEFAQHTFLKFKETPDQIKLGFFYKDTMQSNNPNTKDFLLPLS